MVLFLPFDNLEYFLYAFSIIFLIILGVVSAKIGGSNIGKAVIRVTFWGTIAMGLTSLVGSLFGVNI